MSDKQGAPTLPPLTGGGGNNGGSNGGAPQQTVSLQQVFANVLSSGNVQQFVLASQVPGLAQVLPSGGTTNQPIGVTRIVNLSGTTPRVSVVNVSGASAGGVTSAAALTSPGRQNPKLVLTTSPKLVRTSISNMFVTPASQATTSTTTSPGCQPAKKRARLAIDGTERSTSLDPSDAMGYRRRIMEHKLKKMRAIRDKYNDNASELFFLHNGGNLMDYYTWRKRAPTAQYLSFMKQHRLEADDDEEELLQSIDTTAVTTTTATANTNTTSTTTTTVATTTIVTSLVVNTVTSVATTATQSTEVAVSGGTPVAVSTTLPPAVAQLSQQGQVPGRPQGGRHGMVFAFRTAIQASAVTAHPSPTTTIAPALIIGGTPIVIDSSKPSSVPPSNPVADKLPAGNPEEKPATPPITSQPVVKLVKLPPSSIASSCDTVSNQEQIVEKAKQEAYVMQRIAELQREGLWSERRLPKVQEPPRPKAHWDYLLEEMVWLSTDFAQERKWKKSAAKKCARMVQKYFQEKAIQAQKAEKLEELRLKKIAGFIAKEIKTFWANVEKLVEYKQQTRLEEKRKKALDQHLNFIVDQTEKYSSWLTEGLNKTEGTQSTPASIHSSRISSPVTTGKNSDDDFKPNQCSDDDEETIAKAEEEMKSNHKEEVELLKKESELPLEDLLKELPPNYLEERDKSLSPLPREVVEGENDNVEGKDTEFTIASDESSDDEEDTIQEQEKLEKDVDHKKEIDDLNAENEMTIEELMAKYGNAQDISMNVDESDDESDKDENEDEEEENESESENENESSEDETQDDSQTQSDEEANVGLKSLLEDLSDENKSINEAAEKQNEMDCVAALAESIQPKGNTLLTTSVVTKIPFLLKHCLREYQHIGLDWLVTMFERKLNGILADEMGLGKTIQTIALLAHLACEKGNWGPHLIIVPTSVMLNWEMECKKWCPGFKILTYYGTQKERKQKRTGWTKPNAFHICITSYKLVIQDHQSFRRKKWKYLILDEAQNIKNFKSQRWQLLLNFQTQRRLLLTGTPLQNNLMELWSLMHFLMPNVFQSHREFKEWFSNPVTGMIEGNNEYNENIIRRLHKVLRPFLLRRLKCEVEKQLPKKYEHVIMCRLSKRQRYLYDDFMSRAKTKETLASGNLLSVINVLMQLRKVCNHPNLFEVRPTVSPFQMEGIDFHTASLAWGALDYNPFKHIDLSCLNLQLIDLEFVLTAFVAHRIRRIKTPRKLIEEIDSQPEPAPRCPPGKIKINVRLSNQVSKSATSSQQSPHQIKIKSFPGVLPTPRVGTSPLVKNANSQAPTGQGVTLKVAGGQQLQGFSVQLVPHQGGVKAIPVGTVAQNIQSTGTPTPTTTGINAQRITIGNSTSKDGSQRLTTHTYTVKHGDSVQKYQVPSFAQLVQTSTGRHIILTNPNQQTTNALSFPVMTSSGQRLTVLSKQIMGLSTTPVSVNKVIGGVVTTTASGIGTRPVMRVPPLNVSGSQPAGQIQAQTQIRCGVVARHIQKDVEKNPTKEEPKSEFYLPELEEARKQRRQAKLATLADINERRCDACPLYGEDLFTALRMEKPATTCQWDSGWLHCASRTEPMRTRKQYFTRTAALAAAIKTTEQIVEELKELFDRFVVYVPAVRAPMPRFSVSHPPPHKLWKEQRLQVELHRHLSPKVAMFHPITRSMLTQFPDPRLIQYDCGKLQSLDLLLRDLKADSHRVLIFTQMTRMLDVLEAFLNYHGYIYLRLDGATKVDQRQVLMERFNNDKRIFCFILSTRSGGVGVNLTGADTVVFYDSDWNPTMDAQAQDRCHRIGQTRDVHIYRLISERTVEENILKKANQKRLLGDLAIEGGNFTTAYFKSSTIQDLFNVDQSEADASARMAEVLDQSKDREKNLQKEVPPTEDKVAIGALESALAAVEEDQDVQAAKTAKAEAVADLAEFDENIPVDDADNDEAQVSKAELEVQNIVSQLTPVERYAMRFVEDSDGSFSAAQLAAAERELEEQKKEWELDRLRAMREEEERQMRMTDDDENPLTFTREDAQNQVNNSSSNSRRVINKRPPRPTNRRGRARRVSVRNRRQRGSRRTNYNREEEEMSTSDSESETTSLTDTDSPNDDGAPEQSDSSDEEDRKSSQVDSQDEQEHAEEEESDNDEKIDANKGVNLKNSLLNQTKNHLDLNSPRTRSRGNVRINLWTLDKDPLLPEIKKPRHRSKKIKDSADKSDDGLTGSPIPDKVLDNSELSSTLDVSAISSTDESICNEENRIRTKRIVTKISVSKSTVKTYEKDIEESDLIKDDNKKAIPNSEQQGREVKAIPSTTPNRPGRPRKQSQSSPAAATTIESNLVTYSTRSSNKLPSTRALQDKRAAAPKISDKEELEICDINVTSNSFEKSVEENKGMNNASVDTTVRPKNESATSNIVPKDNQGAATNKKPKTTQQQQELKGESTNVQNESSEENRSPSPILSIKKTKITRSYSRVRIESKDKEASATSYISDQTESSSSDKQKLPITPMEVDIPMEKNLDNGSLQNKPSTVERSSPVFNTKVSKVTRSTAKPSVSKEKVEAKDKCSISEVMEQTKEKQIGVETRKEEKCETVNIKVETKEILDSKLEDSKSHAESILSVLVEPENCSPKSANEVNPKEQVKAKVTRSSTRSTADAKPKEKSSASDEVSEQSKSTNLHESTAVPSMETEKAPPPTQDTEKEEQQPLITKITRSSVRTTSEIHTKSNKNTDAANRELTNEAQPIDSKSSDAVIAEQATTKTESTDTKLPEQAAKSVNLEGSPLSSKDLELEIKSPIYSPVKQSKETTTSQSQNSAKEENSTKENNSTSAASQNSKAVVADTTPSMTPETKTRPRRLRANCNFDTTLENKNTEHSNVESKTTSTTSSKESKVENINAVPSEMRSQKSTNLSELTSEQTRVTRSNVNVPNPLSRHFLSPPKPGLRRRPDTPMPRPVTRSLSNSSSENEPHHSPGQNQQKFSPRMTRASAMDNGFVIPSSPPVTVRRSRSTTYIKMSERLAMERKEITITTSPKGHENLTINRVITKRRPDTPLPSPEQISRVGKANIEMHSLAARSLIPMNKIKPVRRAFAVPQLPPPDPVTHSSSTEQKRRENSNTNDSTESNGNLFEAEAESSTYEKPQRTAKVVAILSLDSKGTGKIGHHTSPQKTKPLISDKILVNNTRSSRLSRAVHGSKIQGSPSAMNLQDNSSVNSSVIATIDLDDEPDYTGSADASQRMSKRSKRTRLNSQAPRPVIGHHKPSGIAEIQTIELEDEEDDKIPLKKANRPPPSSAVSGSSDETNNPAS